MNNYPELIFQFMKSLLPTGLAFRIAKDSVREKLYKAIASFIAEFYEEVRTFNKKIIPLDTDIFTPEDADIWEERFSLIYNKNSPSPKDKLLY